MRELAELLLILTPEDAAMREAKARGLMDLARQETSANGRHDDIARAREMTGDT